MVQGCNGQPDRNRLQCCSRAGEMLAPELFRALADPTRVGVLLRLMEAGEPATVSEVAGCCAVDLSVVSRHLKALRQAGVAASEKRGKQVHYRVLYGRLAATLRQLAEAIEACCPDDSAAACRRGGDPTDEEHER